MESHPENISFEEGASHAANLFRSHDFQEAFSVSETFLEAIEAFCVSQKIDESSILLYHTLRKVQGLSSFFLGHYEKAFNALLDYACKPGEDSFFETDSEKHMHMLIALSAMGSSQVSREELLVLLYDTTRSPLKDAYDNEYFIPFVEMGIAFADCDYAGCMSKLHRVLHELELS